MPCREKMDVGISSACFYPLETEKALTKLGEYGVDLAEIFFNSPSEVRAPLVNELDSLRRNYGIRISSVHPYLSFGETYLAFSEYYRRFLDTVEEYKRFFDAANMLDCKYCIFHGEKQPLRITEDEYLERVAIIAEQARKQGACFVQENIVNFRSGSVDFLGRMKERLGELFCLNLDVKQAVRCGESPIALAEKFGSDIVNIHISDHDATCDCLPPLSGVFSFPELFSVMNDAGYKGDYIIELYRWGFKDDAELLDSYKSIRKMLKIYCKNEKI